MSVLQPPRPAGQIVVADGAQRDVDLTATVTLACGCVIEIPRLASTRFTVWQRLAYRLGGPRAHYVTRCAHRTIEEVLNRGK